MFGKSTRMPSAAEALPGRATTMPVPAAHFVNGHELAPPFPENLERAMFGLGCFWGAERKFWQRDGVYTTAVGYAAGITPNPTYREVCTGMTGHNEVVLVVFDPARVSYEELLRVFWENHDPTQGMSATIDAEQVASFLGDCGVVRVSGRRHPVAIHFEPTLDPAAAVSRALEASAGNVVCFQPGAAEIERTMESLRRWVSADVEVMPLHGGLPAAKQDLALDPRTGPRRVVVATNIAETSVTIPGVTAVVDIGLEKVARYDANRAIDSLQTERISQAAADQRAGRAGRTGPGVAFRLWNPLDRLKCRPLPSHGDHRCRASVPHGRTAHG